MTNNAAEFRLIHKWTDEQHITLLYLWNVMELTGTEIAKYFELHYNENNRVNIQRSSIMGKIHQLRKKAGVPFATNEQRLPRKKGQATIEPETLPKPPDLYAAALAYAQELGVYKNHASAIESAEEEIQL